jgi:hypothetical protein
MSKKDETEDEIKLGDSRKRRGATTRWWMSAIDTGQRVDVYLWKKKYMGLDLSELGVALAARGEREAQEAGGRLEPGPRGVRSCRRSS